MNNSIGQHIRNLRKSKVLKLKDLSEKSGLSIPYLSDIERDTVNPSLKSLQVIAKSLDITLPEIVDFNGELDKKLMRENIMLKKTIVKFAESVKNIIEPE